MSGLGGTLPEFSQILVCSWLGIGHLLPVVRSPDGSHTTGVILRELHYGSYTTGVILPGIVSDSGAAARIQGSWFDQPAMVVERVIDTEIVALRVAQNAARVRRRWACQWGKTAGGGDRTGRSYLFARYRFVFTKARKSRSATELGTPLARLIDDDCADACARKELPTRRRPVAAMVF